MLKSLNFKHIFYFWLVARENSIKRTSDLLNVAPSSISEQIKLLEYRLDIDLFDRTQRKMLLTSQGQVLFNNLNEFFPKVEELFESMVNHKSFDVKFLRIGLCPTLSTELRDKLCFPFIEDIHYTVKVLQGENQFLINAFDEDQIDILFTTNSQIRPHGKYEKILIAKNNFCIITNENIYKKLPKKNYIKALNDYKYINYTSDSDLHFQISNFFNKHNINPMRIAEIDDFNLIKNTIEKLDCFSILPLDSVKDKIARNILYQVGKPINEIDSEITAIYKPKFISERFSDHLKTISSSIKK